MLAHKQAVFDHLVERWRDLFNASFDVLLYDPTSTPISRPIRRLPRATSAATATRAIIGRTAYKGGHRAGGDGRGPAAVGLRDHVRQHGRHHHAARRFSSADRAAVWRGPPRLGDGSRGSHPGRARPRCDKPIRRSPTWSARPRAPEPRRSSGCSPGRGTEARPGVQVKLLPQDGELYVFAQSADRVAKERAMRRRQLKWLCARLKQLSAMRLTREELLMKLGAARQKTPTARRLIEIEVSPSSGVFSYRLDRNKLRVHASARGTLFAAHQSHRARSRQALDPTICSSSRSKKPSRTSRAISRCARSSTRMKRASRRTSSSRSFAYCLHVTLKRRLHRHGARD